MSIHVVLTGAIYHGYERRLCLQRWKTAWLNFYLPLWKGSCAQPGGDCSLLRWCIFPWGWGREGTSFPNSLCPSVLHRKKPWQGRGRERVSQRAGGSRIENSVLLGMGWWDGSCPPAQAENQHWGSHHPPSAALQVWKYRSNAPKLGTEVTWHSGLRQQWMGGSRKCSAGVQEQQELVLASLEIVWEKQKRL